MNLIDIIIILLIICIAFTGIRNGFFKQTVITVGTIIVFFLAFYTKDFIADFLSYNLPFFNFAGPIEGLKSLNIIMYQLIGFLIMFALFSAVLAVLVKITGGFEKLLKATIVLGIPSRILGFLVGLVEGYVVVFIALIFLNQPVFNIPGMSNSKLVPIITKSSPALSKTVKNLTDTVDDVFELVYNYSANENKDKFNYDSVKIMLDNKMINATYVEKLAYKGKIYFTGLDDLIKKYK